MRTLIRNGNVYDPVAGTFLGERTVVVEDGVIVELAEGPVSGDADVEVEAGGRFVLPGFIDAHVHLGAHTLDFARIRRDSDVEWGLAMAPLAAATVARGFTTVRDAGGDIRTLVQAIRSGLCGGPRVVRAGHIISQTGGHGDFRPSDAPAPCCGCEIVATRMSYVADGVDAVRKAVRSALRDGSAFIKIMTSGGVASPSDPLDSIQYTADEVRAAVVEAQHRHTYVTSHAYSPESVLLAAENGVACIEHGNMVDAATAARLAELGTTVVPTLSTYRAMAEIGASFGMPQVNLDKNDGVFEAGQAAVGLLRDAGVELGFGTDLLGEAQVRQCDEFAIRAELEGPVDVLRSMYVTNARLCGLEGKVGTLAPGAYGDAVVTEVDPLEDLAGLADHESALAAVVQGGRVVVDRLDG